MFRRVTAIVLPLVILNVLPVHGQVPDSSSRERDNTESQIFMGVFQNILARHQTTFSDSVLWEAALDGLIQGLNDPYATVFTPDELGAFEESNTGNYAGIGVQITELNNRVTITAVFRQTPADEAGLVVGDQIVEVKGVDARDWTVDMARDSIRGPAGTVVDLKIEREGFPEPMALPIRRDNVHVPAVTATTLHDSLGYILVDQVARGSAREVDSVFALLPDAKGIILDLRRNPGGYFDESLSMADLFLEPGMTLARTVSRKPGQPDQIEAESWTARMPPRVSDKTLIVLVDRYTASAAEIVAGALQDYDRAVILGEPTFGKGVVQTVVPLPGERALRITTGDWRTPLGRSLHIPRDMEGRPLEEPEDSFPTIMTPMGRALRADGGVHPDLVIEDDTLTSVEQNLLLESARAEIPLTLRITEFAFEQVRKAQDGTGPEELDSSVLDAFYRQLVEEGLPPEQLESQGAKDYLSWRVRMAFANRAQHLDHALEFQAERDRVLAAALEFLEKSGSQADLFALVAQEALADGQAHAQGSGNF